MRHLVTTWCPPGDHLVTASWPRGDHLVATGWPLFHYFSIVKSDSGPMASTAVLKWRPKSLRSKRSTNGGRRGGALPGIIGPSPLTLPFQYGSKPSYYKVQLCFNSDFQCIFIFSLVNDFEIHWALEHLCSVWYSGSQMTMWGVPGIQIVCWFPSITSANNSYFGVFCLSGLCLVQKHLFFSFLPKLGFVPNGKFWS